MKTACVDIFRDIGLVLQKANYSMNITELSYKTSFDRTCISKYLHVFEVLGLVKSYRRNTYIYYEWVNNKKSDNN